MTFRKSIVALSIVLLLTACATYRTPGGPVSIPEFTAMESQRSDLWGTQNAIEKARLAAERNSFAGALSEVEKSWSSIYSESRVSGR